MTLSKRPGGRWRSCGGGAKLRKRRLPLGPGPVPCDNTLTLSVPSASVPVSHASTLVECAHRRLLADHHRLATLPGGLATFSVRPGATVHHRPGGRGPDGAGPHPLGRAVQRPPLSPPGNLGG